MSEIKREIPAIFKAFQVFPHENEVNDEKIPKNLEEAIVLFLQTKNDRAADLLYTRVTQELGILQAGPDGKSKISVGRAVICWSCGYCGIPSNTEELTDENKTDESVAKMSARCTGCGDDHETNYVQLIQPDGSGIPWIDCDVSIPIDIPTTV